MSWTDERVELLRKLWQDGLSASQIAGELGGGITRNAVIGKVHRLGMSGRVKPPNAATARPRAPKPARPMGMMATMRPLSTRGNTALAAAPIAAEMPRARMEQNVIPISECVTITDLREHMCRWPLGDPTTPEFRFCGARTGDVGPYCAGHARMAYQPMQDRRRDRGLTRFA
ncbi:MAG: GcrA cell cycle regulator [Methylobacteriaceae bacterium]|nr:GcrA cell cycle regulator [Methylobacteriaceae bacterium]